MKWASLRVNLLSTVQAKLQLRSPPARLRRWSYSYHSRLLKAFRGVLFQQLAIVVAFSLIVSLVVALSVVPMLAARLYSKDGDERAVEEVERSAGGENELVANRHSGWLDQIYSGLLGDALRYRFVTVFVAAMLIAGSVPIVPLVGTEFMPPSDEGEVRVNGQMEVGTRLDIVDRQTRMMEASVFPHVPEVVSALVSVGASNWNPSDAAEGEIQMSLKPAAERDRSNKEIADDLRRRLEGQIPGMKIRTRAPQGQRLLERILGGNEGLEVEVRGFDLSTLDALMAEARRRIEDVPGITDVRVSKEAGVPQELIHVDREKAADLGVSVRRVAETLETALGGTRAGEYREGGNEHRILVRLRDARKVPLERVLDMTIRSDQGENVSLRNLLDVESTRGPVLIERKDQQRYASLTANISGRDMGSIAAEVREKLRDIPKPIGYEFTLAGTYEEQQRASRELLFTFGVAIMLVYMVLASQYESFGDPLVVMLSVPTAAVGVIVVLFLTRTTFNVQSYIGCVMLGGIVVNNAILLVDQARRLREQASLTAAEAVMEAGRRRLRPILMTTLTTILGLLPLALGLGEGSEAQAPLARAVIGGLAFSTLVTLVLVPAVYTIAHRDTPVAA